MLSTLLALRRPKEKSPYDVYVRNDQRPLVTCPPPSAHVHADQNSQASPPSPPPLSLCTPARQLLPCHTQVRDAEGKGWGWGAAFGQQEQSTNKVQTDDPVMKPDALAVLLHPRNNLRTTGVFMMSGSSGRHGGGSLRCHMQQQHSSAAAGLHAQSAAIP